MTDRGGFSRVFGNHLSAGWVEKGGCVRSLSSLYQDQLAVAATSTARPGLESQDVVEIW